MNCCDNYLDNVALATTIDDLDWKDGWLEGAHSSFYWRIKHSQK